MANLSKFTILNPTKKRAPLCPVCPLGPPPFPYVFVLPRQSTGMHSTSLDVKAGARRSFGTRVPRAPTGQWCQVPRMAVKEEFVNNDGQTELRKVSKSRAFVCRAAVYTTALVDSADAVMLSSVFRALERDFLVGPSVLGSLSLCQAVSQSMSSLFWGYKADLSSRKKSLITGCIIVGISTMLVGIAQSIPEIAVYRILTGFGLSACGPIAQSLISDLVIPSRRGEAYGILGFTTGIGSIMGTIFATSVSQLVILGFSGWRFAFFAMAALALTLSFVVITAVFDPERGGMDKVTEIDVVDDASDYGPADAVDSSDDTDNPNNPLVKGDGKRAKSTFLEWTGEILGFFRIRTFFFLVTQGVVGCIPWNAMVFVTLYLQYVGFSDVESSTIFSFMHFGGMLGNLFGGWLGDFNAKISPDHGRIFTAQASVLMGIPFVVFLFHSVPRDTEYYGTFALVLFMLGFTCSWCSPCCNRPILSEIVPVDRRSSVFAVMVAVEGSMGALGSPLVGVLSEKVFGYRISGEAIKDIPLTQRTQNTVAIAEAATYVMTVPWFLCLCFYSFLHLVYPNERRRMMKLSERSDNKGTAGIPT